MKKKAVHRRSVASARVYAAQLSLTLSYFTHSYILGSKRKRKEADDILYFSMLPFSAILAQSAGAAEYTDCISAGGVRPLQ